MRTVLTFFVLIVLSSIAGAQTILPLTFRTGGGQQIAANAALLDDAGTFVTVLPPGANIQSISVAVEDRRVKPSILSRDLTNSLVIGQFPLPNTDSFARLGSADSLQTGAPLKAGGQRGALAGWSRMQSGRIFPLALMQVNFLNGVPVAGTPVVSAQDGALVGLVHSAVPGQDKRAYVLPERAIRRLLAKGDQKRPWLGLVMRADNSLPVITTIRPNSPAEKAGLQEGDVLIALDDQPISTYTDAVDAFYYVQVGSSCSLKVLRGIEQIPVQLTPEDASRRRP